MTLREDIEKLTLFLRGSPWMANLTAALESDTNVSLVVGTVDNCVHIRDSFGMVSLDTIFPAIEKIFHKRFGDHSVWWGAVYPYYLILLTGDEADNALGVAESVRAMVGGIKFSEEFDVTMHFGVTEASPSWGMAGGLRALLKAADLSIDIGKQTVVTNRVYRPANRTNYWERLAKGRLIQD